MQRYMLRMLVIFAVIGLLSAPLDLIRRLRRGPQPAGPMASGPSGSAPVWRRPAA